MDDHVQQHYLAAEQAYGDGDFVQAEAIASTLLNQLEESSSSAAEEEARLAWRAFIALLLGHIHFHGLKQPEPALNHYQLALQSQPPETLRDLAEQGVERCEAQITATSTVTVTAPNPGPNPSPAPAADPAPAPIHSPDPGLALIRDPFLGPTAGTPSAPVAATPSATPWLGEGATENSMQPGAQNNPAPAHTVFTRDAPIAEPDRSMEDAKSDDNTPDTVDDATLTVETNTVLTETATTEAEFARETTPERAITQQTINLTPWLLRRTIAFNND